MERFNYSNDLIDDLLGGKLNQIQHEEALKVINANPTLKTEFEFQSNIIEGLKAARKSELKARLNAIDIDTSLIGIISSSGYLKYAAGVVVATSIGLAGYFLYSPKSDRSHDVIDIVSSKNKVINLSETAPSLLPARIEPIVGNKIDDKSYYVSNSNRDYSNIEDKQEKIATAKRGSKIQIPSIENIEVTESFDDEKIIVPTIEANPKVKTYEKSSISSEIENIIDSKFDFHYQYSNNKLFLHGNFKGIPYEIIEIHGKNGRSTYLKYQNSYYYLTETRDKVKPLERIQDATLVAEIEALKKEKL